MTIKNDLKDIGYLLITPVPKKFRFEGVNYPRATRQLTIGALALQVGSLAAIFYGPLIADKLVDLKAKMLKKTNEK